MKNGPNELLTLALAMVASCAVVAWELSGQTGPVVREVIPLEAPAGGRVIATGSRLIHPGMFFMFPDASAAPQLVYPLGDVAEVVVPANATSGNLRVVSGSTLLRETPFTVTADPAYTRVMTLAGGRPDPQREPLKKPYGAVVVLSDGNVYAADTGHNQIRKISPAGEVTVFAGSGRSGLNDGVATAAEFKAPRGIAFDPERNVFYVADTANHAIRKVTLEGAVTTLAGSGRSGDANGFGTAAELNNPVGITVGRNGVIYVADSRNNRVRRITPEGVVTTFAGSGANGGERILDGALLSATFDGPEGIVAGGDVLYVADTRNNAIRRILGGNVTTVLATGKPPGGESEDDTRDTPADPKLLKRPTGIAVDEAGDLIVADSENDFLRKISLRVTPPVMTTIAGIGKNGWSDGAPLVSEFKDPSGIMIAGAVYIADEDNDAIRLLCPEVRLTGISMLQKPVAGTDVRVFGSGFVPGQTRVTFAGVAATDVRWISSTMIVVKLAAAISSGTVDVTVTSCGGTIGPRRFTLDLTPPVIEFRENSVLLAEGAKFGRNAIPEIRVTDDFDPSPAVAATLNGVTYTSLTPVPSDGVFTLIAKATDFAGNVVEKTVRFTVDKTPPAVTVREGTTPFPSGFHFKRDVVVNLTIQDLTATTTAAKINGNPYAPGTPFAPEGSHSFTARVTDEVGNFTDAGPIPFVIDRTAPLMSFTSHIEGKVLGATRVTLVGGSDDAVSARIAGGAASIDAATKRWTSVELTMDEGANRFTVTGTDRAGNTGTARLNLVLDTRAPLLTVTLPQPDECIASAALEIKGTVDDPRMESVKVRVEDRVSPARTPVEIVATLDATKKNWSASFPSLTEGEKSVTVEAKDSLGNSVTRVIRTTIDRTAPVIDVSEGGTPFTATLVNRPVVLSLLARDADSATKLVATLGGAPYASGNRISTEGEHRVEITATDCARNESRRTVTFSIDTTPPSITSLTPANGTTTGTMPAAITGVVSSDTATVTIDGTPLTAATNGGQFTIAPPIAEGLNSYVLALTDRAGNSARVAYSFTVDTTAPSVEILENGSPLRAGTLYNRAVRPVVRSSEASATVSAQLNGAPFISGAEVSADGAYTLSASAADTLGHSATAQTSFTIDRTPPSVAITSPATGARLDADTVEVRGTTGDSISVLVNGTPASMSGTNFVATLSLEVGETTITAIGRDRAGNAGRADVLISREGAGPGILITYPADRSVTNRSRTDVTGQALSSLTGNTVSIGRLEVPGTSSSSTVDGAGDFRGAVSLAEGLNTITVTGRGADGRETTARVRVTADLTPPLLIVSESGQALGEGARFAERAVITAVATDANGPVVTVLSLDGTLLTGLTTTVTTPGGHALLVTARDAAGNEARIERTFFIGTTAGVVGCRLEGFDPIGNATILAPSMTLTGRTGGAVGVKVGGIAALVADGSFSATVELTREGENVVEVVCTDAEGRPLGTPTTLRYFRITSAPSITIDLPAEDAAFDTAAITVSGTVSADATAVSLNGQAATITGTTWSATGVRLTEGLNVLAARATNRAGRSASGSRRVLLLQTAPTITITSPSPGTVVGDLKTDVSGVWSNLDPALLSATVGQTPLSAIQSRAEGDTTGSFTLKDVPLTAGDNTITVTGRNRLGRVATASVIVRVVAGTPSIQITAPADNSYFGSAAGETLTVTGTFRGAAGSTVEVNGAPATLTATAGTWSAVVPFATAGATTLAARPTILTARITEPSGNSASQVVRVTKLGAAPKVVEAFPAPNAVEVDRSVMLLVLFSSPMDRASLTGGGFTLENGAGTPVTGRIYLDKQVLTFAPAALLTEGERYTIKLSPSAKDLGGNPLAEPFSSSFSIAAGAPSSPPAVSPVAGSVCGDSVTVAGTAPAGARIRVESGTTVLTSSADATGKYSVRFPLSGQIGFGVIRVQIIGSDGSLSPAAELRFRAGCSGPEVLGATYDRATNKLTIDFSDKLDPATVTTGTAGAISLVTSAGRVIAATAAIISERCSSATAGCAVAVTPNESLSTSSFTLTVTTAVKGVTGTPLKAPFTQLFSLGGPTEPVPGDGTGYISGEVFDATTGRPLAGATVVVRVPSAAAGATQLSSLGSAGPVTTSPARRTESPSPRGRGDRGEGPITTTQTDQSQTDPSSPVALLDISVVTDPRGRYLVRLPEGAHTIAVSAQNYTTAWRQIIVPAGAGVVPIDIRLTQRGDTKPLSTTGITTLAHGGDTTITQPTTLAVSAASLQSASVTLTAAGAQSLAGLLPLGWSPLASAEIATPGNAIQSITPPAQLTFTVPQAAITAAAQTLAAVRYDSSRDEWQVLAAVVTIAGNNATISAGTTGAYALVYADKAPAIQPPPAVTGAALQGIAVVPAPSTLVSKSFTLDPPVVLPTGRTVATLEIEASPAAANPVAPAPSGTAVQAWVDEELKLADGTRLLDPPFATDLLLYRNLAGDKGIASFHLAPSSRAKEVILEIGFEHIRILPYPGRLDRGTLIGTEGGRVPGDERVAIDIPAGAAPEPLKATASSITSTELASFGDLEGYALLGGFRFDLQRATQPPPQDLDRDGVTDPVAPVQLFRSANVTVSIDPTKLPSATTQQLILAEVIDGTPYGRIIRLAALLVPLEAPPTTDAPSTTLTRYTTRPIDRATLPVDGVITEARYLILAAKLPVAFATGTLRRTTVVLGAKILTPSPSSPTPLAVTDLTRATGLFAIPVTAKPATPFQLIPRHPATGDGAPYTHPTSPDLGAIVTLSDLPLVPQPPRVASTTPSANATDVPLTSAIRVTFTAPIDVASVNATSIRVVDPAGVLLTGSVKTEGSSVITWTLPAGERFKPDTRYLVSVSAEVRGSNGTPLGQPHVFAFSTVKLLTTGEVRPERIRITIPDANGRSRIYGIAGALPSGWQAVAVRRGKDFTTRPQASADQSGAFSFFAGCESATPCRDVVLATDLIDLHVINTAGSLAAIIPLTPFSTDDARGFIAPAGTQASFTSADGITITVPRGAFEVATLITVSPAPAAVFSAVPDLDKELNLVTSVRLEFTGTARIPLDVELPVPAGTTTANRYFLLARLGESVLGPRMMIVNTLRVAAEKFTTSAAPQAKNSSLKPDDLNLSDFRSCLFGVIAQGSYSALDIRVPTGSQVGWSVMTGFQQQFDFLIDAFRSLYTPSHFAGTRKDCAAVPVLTNRPFTITAVDSQTGFASFTRSGVGPGELGGSVPITRLQPNSGGPHPTWSSFGKVGVVEIAKEERDITSLRGYLVRLSHGLTTVTRTEGVGRWQVLNTSNGAIAATETDSLQIAASRGDSLSIIARQNDLTSGTRLFILFNEPIGDGDAITQAGLDAFFENHIKVEKGRAAAGDPRETEWTDDITEAVTFHLDSGSRRLEVALDSLDRAGRYRVLLRPTLPELAVPGEPTATLGQIVRNGTAGPALPTDLQLEFWLREPAGSLTGLSTQGRVRDYSLSGNLLFVSSNEGGITAYDVKTLSTTNPAQAAPVTTIRDGNEAWALTTDHHGRVFATAMNETFGFIRSYRADDFIPGTDPVAPSRCADPSRGDCRRSTAIVTFRPGVNGTLPLSSSVILSDRPEAFPRKMHLAFQDDQIDYVSREALVSNRRDSLLSPAFEPVIRQTGVLDDEINLFTIEVPYAPALRYATQAVTVQNLDMNTSWSAEATHQAVGSNPPQAKIEGIMVRAGDRIRILRNRATYAVVALTGHGVGVYDLNAIESNDFRPFPENFVRVEEQIALAAARSEITCDQASRGAEFRCPIPNLSAIPEALIQPSVSGSSFVVQALAAGHGILDIAVTPPTPSVPAQAERRTTGLVLSNRFGSGSVAGFAEHPRIASLRRLYQSRVAGAPAGSPNARFTSIAPYQRREAGGSMSTYLLVAAYELGLLVVDATGSSHNFPLGDEALADVIWLPRGAESVRVIEGTHLAAVVDLDGRAVLIDLTRIDERDRATNATDLFPTAKRAIERATAGDPYPYGQWDPRVVWKSAPGIGRGLPPIVDPETGLVLVANAEMKYVKTLSISEGKVRVLTNTGRSDGLGETDGIVPLGYDPPRPVRDSFNRLRPCDLAGADVVSPTPCRENASLAAFRLEMSLPPGITDSISSLRLAVESERVPGAVSEQTALGLPRSALRKLLRNGDREEENREASTFEMKRVIPPNAPNINRLRFQKGYNRFVSPWIVAIGDIRASKHYRGPADPRAEGCLSCQRPRFLEQRTEAEGVYELWTDGRWISIRPDGDLLSNPGFYAYVTRSQGLTARVPTLQARKVRAPPVGVAAHNPPVAEGMLQETHYLHSGEVETASVDYNAGGRAGVEVVIARHYRSRTLGSTALGEGWDSPMFRFLLVRDSDVEFHDGAGEIWLFEGTPEGYRSPKGLFLKLVRTESGWTMLDQQWRIASFDGLGRLVSESDEFYKPTEPGSGNFIRYLYDASGRLASIIDPVGRATELTYWTRDDARRTCEYPGSRRGRGPCGFAGRLKRVETAWRRLSSNYQYDELGRLVAVNLPGIAKGPGVPDAYDFTGERRPTIEYSYAAVPAPQQNEPFRSPRFTDFIDLGGNLTSIKDPAQVLAGTGGVPRVTFTYENTESAQRDRNLSQTWATGETATFAATETIDVLGQRRTYTLTGSGTYDGRQHIASKRVHEVPVMEAAAGGLPDAITAMLTPLNRPQLETSYTYNSHGLVESLTQPNGLTVTNSWLAGSNGAPGAVLAKTTETGPGVYRETQYVHDTAPNASANVSGVGRRSDPAQPFSFRDHQRPSRNRRTVATQQEGVSSKAVHDAQGQLEQVSTGDATGSDSIRTSITYYPESDSNPIESGRPQRVKRGGGEISLLSSYAMTPGGGETETTRDEIRGQTTTMTRDVQGRIVGRKVISPAGTTLTDELYGYNVAGQLAWQSRNQTPIGQLITTHELDVMGRDVLSETTGATVFDVVSGGTVSGSLFRRKSYNLSLRESTESDPYRTGGIPAQSTAKLDGQGRITSVERKSASGNELTRSTISYDIHGNKAYETDGVRVATLTRHDALGRETGSIFTDGTRTEIIYNEWDEPIETRTFEKAVAGRGPRLALHTKSEITPLGRLRSAREEIEAGGRSRGTRFTWEQGERVTTTRVGALPAIDAPFAPADLMRVEQTIRDSAGRVVAESVGRAAGPDALLTPNTTIAETRVTDYLADMAIRSELAEPLVGRKSEVATEYDGLSRPVTTSEGGGAWTTRRGYDEEGNVTSSKEPGLPVSSARYDSRGLPLEQILPDGTTIRQSFDELGNLRRYIDEENRTTSYETDGLGRTTKIGYPDGTSEEVRFENGTGVVTARRDRAGQWVWFKYSSDGGRLIEEHLGGNGASPSPAPNLFTEYAYDEAGRIKRVKSAAAAVEYEGFDLLGRPALTRTIRYRRQASCPPAPQSCGTGFSDSPSILDVHTQGHEWSVFDGERTRWRMPAAGGALPATETLSPWRNWIVETRDGAGTLIKQEEATSRTSAASETITESAARGVGRMASRTRGSLTTTFGYADSADALSSSVASIVPIVAPGAPGGMMGSSETKRAAQTLSGTEITRDEGQRIGTSRDLAMPQRVLDLDYDDRRGWLSSSTLAGSAGPAGSSSLRNDYSVRAAGMLERRLVSPRLAPPDFFELGSVAKQTEPLSWKAPDPTPGHQLTSREFLYEATPQPPAELFQFSGGRRTKQGDWTLTYDVRDRLIAQENAAAGRRIEFDYDPNDRLTGRTAYQLTGRTWSLETRTNILARDGLPAEATLVWDPLADRLLAIYEAGRSTASGAAADAGLVRQYVHGEESFDDPVEVLAASGTSVVRHLPLIDHAGAGSLQAIAREDGTLAERVLYADDYGDAPRYLHGAVVERIGVRAVSGARQILVGLTDPIDPATLGGSLSLTALDAAGAVLRTSTATPSLDGDRTITLSLTAPEWTSFMTGASGIEVAVASSLRFPVWGATPVQAASSWEIVLKKLRSSTAYPVIKFIPLSELEVQLATVAATSPSGAELYAMADLYLAGRTDSITDLHTSFKAAPFLEPSSGFAYFRARWYDPATGSFVTPDPQGYGDSSSLYQFAGNDPVNFSDPTGESFKDWWNRNIDGLDEEGKKEFWELTSGVVGTIPILGEITDGVQAFTGYDVIAGKTLTKAERAMAWGALFVPLGGAAAMRKGVEALSTGATRIGKAVPVSTVSRAVPASTVAETSRVINATGDAGKQRFTTGEMRDILQRQRDEGFSHAQAVNRIREGEACFLAGTLVSTITGLKPIEQVSTKDVVLSYNFETGKTEYREVVQTFRREANEIVYVSVLGEASPIGATTEHPFWARRARDSVDSASDEEGWIPAGELQIGDRLQRPSGEWISITAIAHLTVRTQVFNFEVSENHNYYVGGAGVLVHNQCRVTGADGRLRNPDGTFAPSGRAKIEKCTSLSNRGCLGSPKTKAQNEGIAQELESRGWTITNIGGRPNMKEEYIPGLGGGTKGSVKIDVTATKGTRTVRVQTVDTLRDGVTPNSREVANANRARSLLKARGRKAHILMVPKNE